jgi:MoaA/NifB/PqqE/SkfB family radical SAM enzyme
MNTMRDLARKLRFARSFLGRRLVHVNLQILYNCNYRCRICDFWQEGRRHPPRLSVPAAEVISDKLRQIGPQIVSIGGGEPLLHPTLPGIVRALARHHFPVMITNGALITAQTARRLFEAGMVEISVSIDYAQAAKHDAQRGVEGAWPRGVEALKTLQENRTHPEQRVNMISVMLDDNLPEVEPLLELCQELGITYLVTLYSASRGRKPERPPPLDLGDRLLALKRKHRHFVSLRGYLERFSDAAAHGGLGPCSAGRSLCNIDSQGQVTFCIDRLDDPVGNILTEEMEVIEQRLLARHRLNRCQGCWTSCRGSIEALLHGRRPWLNLLDYYQMTRPVALHGRF